MKRLQLVMMLLLVGCTLASCGKAGQSELDRGVSADGMIYSFYGRLSVGNMDPDWLADLFQK